MLHTKCQIRHDVMNKFGVPLRYVWLGAHVSYVFFLFSLSHHLEPHCFPNNIVSDIFNFNLYGHLTFAHIELLKSNSSAGASSIAKYCEKMRRQQASGELTDVPDFFLFFSLARHLFCCGNLPISTEPGPPKCTTLHASWMCMGWGTVWETK